MLQDVYEKNLQLGSAAYNESLLDLPANGVNETIDRMEFEL